MNPDEIRKAVKPYVIGWVPYPKRFAVMGDEITTSVAWAWETSSYIPQLYNGLYATSAAAAANGDEFTFGIFIAAGDYTFYHMARSYSSMGKVDWYVDGSSVATGRDWYSSPGAYKLDSFAVTISTSGYHVVKLKVNGKHASSSDYCVGITKIWGKQAAD